MTRVKRGSIARKKRSEVLKSVAGFRGSNRRLYRIANQRKIRASVYTYIDRRNRKRAFRRLWIKRINGCVRSCPRTAQSFDQKKFTYSRFQFCLKRERILLNRKTLAQLAIFDPSTIKTLVFSLSVNFQIKNSSTA